MQEEKKQQTDFEQGLIALIHDYVTNYPDDIVSISKDTIDKIKFDLLSDFKFEVTYAKKSSLGGYRGEHTIYCDGEKVVELIEEAEEKGTVVELHANPYLPKPKEMKIPNDLLTSRGGVFSKRYLHPNVDWDKT